jgi:diguanylate cyclase (GGDEF)-like protein/PAS domain S-box-containing protein
MSASHDPMPTIQTPSCQSDELSRRFRLMAEHADGYGVLLLDPDGIIVSWNRGAEKINGYPAQEAIGRHFACLYSPEERQCDAPEQDLQHARQHGRHEKEAWHLHKDGTQFRARSALIALHDAGQRLHGFAMRVTHAAAAPEEDSIAHVMVSIFQDVQVLKEARAALAVEQERAQITLKLLTDSVIITDASGCVDYMNPAAEKLTGWTLAEARGKRTAALLQFRCAQAAADPDLVGQCLRDGSDSMTYRHGLLRSRVGREHTVDASAAPIHLPDGCLIGAVLALHDVTESHSLLRTLAHQASHDALTGLINRREFETRLQRALDHAKSGSGTGALIYLDLDQFKIVNDTCGHAAGDDLLQQLAQTYQEVVRERDTFARLGGDEFALIIEHCTVEEARFIANKVLDTTTAFKYPYGGRTFRVGASIGVVPITARAVSIEQMMRLADHACYLAKENGRNRIYVHKENDAALVRRQSDMHWVGRLHEALRGDSLELFYQPIAPMAEKDGLLHYEILLRLRDRDGNWIAPSFFLPAAERFDLMPAVDRWVLKRVLEWLEGEPEHVAKLDMATINLSRRTLADESFQEYAIACLENTPVPPHKLCFEITENGAIANPVKTIKFIETLKERGCRFSLDDFGTGMTSFSYLKLLPVDFIKIDGSFVTMMKDSAVDREMVRFTNEISHIMGRRTIAEYVGDASTYQHLRDLQIDYAQGYWIGAPRPLEAKMVR